MSLRDYLDPSLLKDQSAEDAQIVKTNYLTLSFLTLDMFISNFMPTMFIEDDFISLQSCFSLLRILLKYHDPQVYLALQNAGATPELFATSWFITYFSNKCENIEIASELWSRVMALADQN